MPELPEVESLRRSLIPLIVGQKIVSVKVFKPKLVSNKGTVRTESAAKVKEFETELVGEHIKSLDRRAKNLILTTFSGKIVLIHLKMTGQLVYKSNNQDLDIVVGGHPIAISSVEVPNKHSHIIFELENGTLYFNDTRMFGYLLYFKSFEEVEAENHFENLGVEPFEESFTLKYFLEKMKGRKGNLKALFLSQEVVVGLGNIYCDEVCFDSKVLPTRNADSLSKKELETLYYSILKIIGLAVEAGGSSVANYLLGDGTKGNYAKQHKVYNRGGKECLVCGNILINQKLAGRTTVYCKVCQR
jgi:formamidopyrimidine-DNA glycosylase